MSSLRFEWDEAKDRLNQKKHVIGFDEARRVFEDPLYISAPERVEEDGELRWQTFGRVNGVLLLMVAHTMREETTDDEELIEVIRVITARKATRREVRRYEDENG
jgi:uncharacterized DUF497 family protein